MGDRLQDNENNNDLVNRIEELESANESRNAYRKFRLKAIALLIGVFALAWILEKLFD